MVDFYLVHLCEHSCCLLTCSSVKNVPATEELKDTRAACSAESRILLNPSSSAENMLIEFQMPRCHAAASGFFRADLHSFKAPAEHLSVA